MASEVSICNVALSHVGDAGLITSIDPPDGSMQAARCAVFYPRALGLALEARDWRFATVRDYLADLGTPVGTWAYRYQIPANAKRVSKILPTSIDTREDSSPFVIEALADGTQTILTDVEQATAVYVMDVSNPDLFSDSFASCVEWLLASYLAGPIIKGKAGASFGEYCYKRYLADVSMAATLEGDQHRPKRDRTPDSVRARA